MRVLIIGYGKMGKLITQLLKDEGHEVVRIIDQDNADDLKIISPHEVDVAIEFSTPSSAYTNVMTCIIKGIPVVSGTTAWLDKMEEIQRLCSEKKGAFFYAPNFSVGVNLFFELCSQMARLLNNFKEYDIEMEEIHHTQKLDAPSGTAIAAANALLEHLHGKHSWALKEETREGEIPIAAKREPDVHGTHHIRFVSDIDEITLTHKAHSREGFARGAIAAAQWLIGKQGVFGMKDMLKIAPS